jgi:hypothetical protein
LKAMMYTLCLEILHNKDETGVPAVGSPTEMNDPSRTG